MNEQRTGLTLEVVHIGPHVDHVGGMASVIRELVKQSSSDIRVRSIASWHPKFRLKGVPRSLFLCIKILLRREKFDVAHIHLSERGSFLREGLIAISVRLSGRKVAYTLHGADFVQFARKNKVLTATVLRVAHHIFCLGPNSLRRVNSILENETKTSIVMNPASAPRADLCATRQRSRRVVFAGELSARKGFDRTLEVWSQLRQQYPEYELHVCGPMTNDAFSIDQDGIVYHGSLPPERLRQILADAQLCILPSRREVLPMIMIEAMMEGCLVVAASCGEMQVFEGPAVCVTVQQKGVEEESVVSRLVQSLQLFLDDGRLADVQRVRAREWALKHCETSAVASNLNSQYLSILDRR